jgi:hypothetical protein
MKYISPAKLDNNTIKMAQRIFSDFLIHTEREISIMARTINVSDEIIPVIKRIHTPDKLLILKKANIIETINPMIKLTIINMALFFIAYLD